MMKNDVNVEDVYAFLESRKIRGFKKENVIEVALGGSYASGMVTDESDVDVRMVQLLRISEVFGFDVFEDVKVLQGEGGTSSAGDYDVNVYSSLKWLKALANGELPAWEILFGTDSSRFGEEHEFMREVRKNKHVFDSKSLLFKLRGSYLSCFSRVEMRDKDKTKSAYRMDRISKYGYDTKLADRSLRFLRWMESYATTGRFELTESAEWKAFSVGVRSGAMTLAEYREYAVSEHDRVMGLVYASTLRKRVDLEVASDFSVALHLKYAGV